MSVFFIIVISVVCSIEQIQGFGEAVILIIAKCEKLSSFCRTTVFLSVELRGMAYSTVFPVLCAILVYVTVLDKARINE